MRAQRIEALRASLAKPGLAEPGARVALGHEAADACLKGGLQRGALHEIFTRSAHEAAATGFAAGLAARVAAGKLILWIRQDFAALEFGALSPTGLLELGIDPAQVLLLCAAHAEDCLRAASDALGCAALGAVVIEIAGAPRILDLVASRRLTLACAQKNVTAFLLRLGALPDASTAETRWLVRALPSQQEDRDQPAFEADLVRNRHGRAGSWVMEWSCDDGRFRESAADRGAVVRAPCDRPAAAALEEGWRCVA